MVRLLSTTRSAPRSYPFGSLEQRAFARDATSTMVNLVEGWGGDHTFDRGGSSKEGRSPRPKPVLRAITPGSNDLDPEKMIAARKAGATPWELH
jgi:hypothetical protein